MGEGAAYLLTYTRMIDITLYMLITSHHHPFQVERVVPATLLDDIGLEVRVINLKRRPDRLASIEQRLQPHMLPWHLHTAEDGVSLNWTDLVAAGVVTKQAADEAQLEEATICRRTGECKSHLTLGAVGCAMSHRALWQVLASALA